MSLFWDILDMRYLITQLEICIRKSEESLVRDEALGIIGTWANENHSNG